MEQCSDVFVAIDVAKMRNAIAAADGEREGEVGYLSEIDAAPKSMRRLVKRLAAKHARLHFWTCLEKDNAGESDESVRDGGRYRMKAQNAP